MMDEQQTSGHIGNTGILDLCWATSPEDLANIEVIENVGILRVPDELYGALKDITLRKIGLTVRVPSGKNCEVQGSTEVTGDFLASGDEDTNLLATGQIIVTPPVESVGFKRIIVTGQLILPRGAERVVSGKLGSVTGQVVYYDASGARPRLFLGDDSIGREFLELLPEKAPWVVCGRVELGDDVDRDLLMAKVAEIVLAGQVVAPQRLVPALQALATYKVGEIKVKEE